MKDKRPIFLSVISIFSFISIGFGLLNTVFLLLVGKVNPEKMELAQEQNREIFSKLVPDGDNSVLALIEQLNIMQQGINEQIYLYGIFLLIAYLIGLNGVVLMRKGFKKGLHFYIVYNLLVLSSIYLCVSPSDIPFIYIMTNALFSGMFILFYVLNRNWYKV